MFCLFSQAPLIIFLTTLCFLGLWKMSASVINEQEIPVLSMSAQSASSGLPIRSFLGKESRKLDPKRRLTIPAKWRKLLDESEDEGLYLLPGMGRPCLVLLPKEQMVQMLQAAAEQALYDPDAADLAVALGSAGDHVNFDSMGRVRISDEHLEEAGITEMVEMRGAVTRIELWSPENWAARNGVSAQEAARRMGGRS